MKIEGGDDDDDDKFTTVVRQVGEGKSETPPTIYTVGDPWEKMDFFLSLSLPHSSPRALSRQFVSIKQKGGWQLRVRSDFAVIVIYCVETDPYA